MNFKKKFQVIEEGRLNIREMNVLTGGIPTCTESGGTKYSIVLCTKLYANCPAFYGSCTVDGGFTECKGGYTGNPGPDMLRLQVG
jgi:hypothetical protein